MHKIKEILRLHCESGLSARDIGKAVGISHTAVNKHLEVQGVRQGL